MTREQEILTRAMNAVDDELVAAAHAPRKKLRHYFPTLVAACLCIVIVATFPLVRELVGSMDKSTDAMPPGDAGETGGPLLDNWYIPDLPAESLPSVGDTVRIGMTDLTLRELTDTTATFLLEKRDSVPLYVAIRQYAGGILASTEPNYTDNGTILRPRQIRVSVDGVDQPAATLPIPEGTYVVKLDFSSLRNSNYRMEDTLIFYRYVHIEGGDTIESIRFSTAHPAGTEGESETGSEWVTESETAASESLTETDNP